MKKVDFHTDVLPLKDKIFRLALRITLNRQEAEDIAQETLVRVWQKKDEWNEIENMESYCLTICRRLSLDYFRQQQLRTEKEKEVQEFHTSNFVSTPDDILDQKQRIALIQQSIEQLPEAQRTIIQLRDIEGLSYDEIAQITGFTDTQGKVYLHRARKKIRESL